MAISSITSFNVPPKKSLKKTNQNAQRVSFGSAPLTNVAPSTFRKAGLGLAAGLATLAAVFVGCDASVNNTEIAKNSDTTAVSSDTTSESISPIMKELVAMYDFLTQSSGSTTAVTKTHEMANYQPKKGDILRINTHDGAPFNTDEVDTLDRISGDTAYYNWKFIDPEINDTITGTEYATKSPDGKGVIWKNSEAKYAKKHVQELDEKGKLSIGLYTVTPDSLHLSGRLYPNPEDPTNVIVKGPNGGLVNTETITYLVK